MKRILGFLAAVALLLAHAQAQTPGTSPAQMGITPTTVPEVLQVLDNTKTWVPIGIVNSGSHAFRPMGQSQTITNVLTGFTGPTWTASYHAGGTCLQSHNALFPPGTTAPTVFCGGTEGRQFVAKNPGTPSAQLYLGNGYWVDQPGAEGPQNAQILVLNGPDREGNAWMQDVNLGQTGFAPGVGAINIMSGPMVVSTQYCPTDNPVCAQTVSGLQSLFFLWDNHGNPVNLNVAAQIPANGTFTTSSTTITMGLTIPSSVVPGMYVNDVTAGQGIGTVLSYTGAVLTLTAPAAHASLGTNDQLQFGLPGGTNILVASSWWEGTSTLLCPGQTPVFVWDKNNTTAVQAPPNGDLQWYQTLLECDPGAGSGTPQVRAFGTHIDLSVLQGGPPAEPQDLAFAGASPAGIYSGQLSANRGATFNPIVWNLGTTLEWNGSDYTNYTPALPACTAQTRVMGFAEATGSDGVNRIYMSACFAIYVRIDGPQGPCLSYQVFSGGSCVLRWQLYWVNPNPSTPGPPVNGGSQSGMRGLTVPVGENILLIGTEGQNPQAFYAVQPYPACGTPTSMACWSNEFAPIPETAAFTGFTLGNMVAPYNNFAPINDENGNTHYIGSESVYVTAASTNVITPPWTFMYLQSGGRKLAEAIYTYRNSAGKYNISYIPQLFSTPMNGTRDWIMSPFQDDCGYYGSNIKSCAVYATGNDMDGSPGYYWCKAWPCPSPITYVLSHNLAWAARLGFQN